MKKEPPAGRGEKQYIGCPFCTIQIPEDTTVCPHCRNSLASRPPGEAKAKPARKVLPAVGESAAGIFERYGLWIKAGGPVLLGLIVLLVIYQKGVGLSVKVVPNSSFPVRVETERKGNTVVIRGSLRNEGEDVPDLSLRSIRVVFDFHYRDGRRDRRTVFPKSEYRGEGALLRGETGTFEVVAPSDRLDEVVLRSEIIDLGMGQQLIPARPGRIPGPRR